jgi:predicted ester cyclase
MSVQQHKAILMQGAEAFNSPDHRSGWFEIHDPAVVAHGLAPAPLDYAGLERFYAGLWSGFPDLRITVEDLIGEKEKVAWRLSVRGTHEGEFRGVAPTGTEVTFGAQYVFEFRDRKIVRRWTNFDRLGVRVQLGAVPSPV